MEPVDELGEPAGEVDVAAVDVVERQDAADEPEVVLGHRHPEQQPVEAGPPGVRGERVELVRRPVGGVQPPADAGGGDPLLEPGEVVVVEAEPPAHRLPAGEVEQLRGGDAGVDQLEQLGDGREDRVGLAQRAVGEPDPQVGQAAGSAMRRSSTLDGAERGLDQRGERLDVRAHHDHVARLERRVVGEEVEDRVAEHLDLAGPAVARVHAAGCRRTGRGAGAVGFAGAADRVARRRRGRRPGSAGAACRRGRRRRGGRRCHEPRGRVASRGRRGPRWPGAGCAAVPAVGSSARGTRERGGRLRR